MPLVAAIREAGARPSDDLPSGQLRAARKNYSERLSNAVARVLSERFRALGLLECEPSEDGAGERQFAGGIGAKKVDVSFATEEDGLILGVSIKSIGFPDKKTGNYQKNLTNRRGDLLAEATTLHKRFPYAVLGGLFLFEAGAVRDGTDRRPSTFQTAHEYFRAFSNRRSPGNAVELYEALGIVLYSTGKKPSYKYFDAGTPSRAAPIDSFFSRLLEKVAERNPDRFRYSAATGTIHTRRTRLEAVEADEDEGEGQ